VILKCSLSRLSINKHAALRRFYNHTTLPYLINVSLIDISGQTTSGVLRGLVNFGNII
jgi:hypothetical protein